MTGWVVQEDWSTVAVGDLVRVECDGGLLTGRVGYVYTYVSGRPRAIDLVTDALEDTVNISTTMWSLSVPAKPAVVLPDECGFYLDTNNELAMRQYDGEWRNDRNIRIGPMELEALAPFTRMEPVAVTAKKVLFRLYEAWSGSSTPLSDAISQVLVEFGVTE